MRPIVCLANDPPVLVSELIDNTSAEWRDDRLQQYFLPADVTAIKNIPLCTSPMSDFWAWQFEKKGEFSVRSAYRMLVSIRNSREDLLGQRGAASNALAEEKCWTTLWNTQVPGKIKTFLWRLARHSLPLEDVRHHRNMCDTDSCQICGGVDSWRHSLIDCTASRCVWASGDEALTDHIVETQEPNAKHWLFNMMETLSHADFVKMAVTLWAVWTARRKAIHEAIYQSLMSTHLFVERFISELDGLRRITSSGTSRTRAHVNRAPNTWKPPPSRHAKIYVDGGLSHDGCVGAAAAVCRDDQGNYLGSSAIVLPGMNTPAALEAIACHEALALAADLSLERLTIACDSKTVVDDIKNVLGGTHITIVKEIEKRRANFESCDFMFEGRASNQEAHNLVKFSVSLPRGCHMWLLTPHDPLCIPLNFASN